MDFRITHHSGSAAPDDALDLLLQHLEATRGPVRFTRRGTEIRATLRGDAPVSMESDEREQIGRRLVLDIVREACETAPQLELEWFAVSVRR